MGIVIAMKMATASRTWAVIKNHIPMIKFRSSQINGHGHSAVAADVKVPKNIATNVTPTVNIATVLEDWQLGPRYRRAPISIEEMEYINVGLFFFILIFYCTNVILYIQQGGGPM